MVGRKRSKPKSDRRCTKKKKTPIVGFVVLAVIFAWAALTNVAEAQLGKIYLNIPGIPGGSTDAGYVGWINLTQFSQTLGEGATAKIGVCRCYAVKPLDKASPALWSAVVTRQHFDKVEVDIVTAPDGSPLKLFTQKMDEVIISSIEFGEADGQPTETLTLLPGRVKINYCWRDPGSGSVLCNQGVVVCTTAPPK